MFISYWKHLYLMLVWQEIFDTRNPMQNEQQLVKGGIYQHYKGQKYKLIEVVRHSETLEELVLYEALYKNDLGNFWVRPKKMFFEKLPDGTPRFRLNKE